ncbi:MAG: DsbC family protein [Gammaproteobacteria bacterium]|nr:DsbC family protein [Gammaproteobacteria bacterium]
MRLPMSATLFAAILLTLPVPGAVAGEEEDRQKIIQMIPQVDPDSIRKTPIPGVYETKVGPVVLYVSADGRYVLRGELFDLERDINLTEHGQRQARQAVLASMDESEFITFSPEAPEYTVTVFTDTSCSYCRLLHSEIEEYNDAGIAVRYAHYPRRGLASPNWQEMQNLACATDPQEAMGRAKQDLSFEYTDCPRKDLVMKHFNIGRSLGIRGTPAIFSESGAFYRGYLPPAQLLERLKAEQND